MLAFTVIYMLYLKYNFFFKFIFNFFFIFRFSTVKTRFKGLFGIFSYIYLSDIILWTKIVNEREFSHNFKTFKGNFIYNQPAFQTLHHLASIDCSLWYKNFLKKDLQSHTISFILCQETYVLFIVWCGFSQLFFPTCFFILQF